MRRRFNGNGRRDGDEQHRAGSYRGVTDGLAFEFRIERGREGEVQVVSGDVTRGPDFVGSFLCASPQVI